MNIVKMDIFKMYVKAGIDYRSPIKFNVYYKVYLVITQY